MKPTILLTRGLAIAALIALALAVAPGVAQPGEVPASRPQAAPMPLSPSIPIQGRLTDAAGHPLPDGAYDVMFEVCDSGGPCPCADAYPPPSPLSVEDGLFSAVISNCPADLFDGRQLELQITVEGELLTPRQPIYASPFAWSLRPGAIIHNYETGHALTLVAGTSGKDGSALYAENTNTSGIGVWAKAVGNDATVVIENLGTGPLLKGFGGDLGDDEITITNNGTLQIKRDSVITVPGVAAVLAEGTTHTVLNPQVNGSVKVTSSYSPVDSTILIGIPLPAMLYGQNIDFEGVTIFYRTDSLTYIDSWALNEITYPGGATTEIASDETDLMSTTYVPYSKSISHVYSSQQGFVSLELNLHFDEDVCSIYIGGVALQVGHHPLY
ncbi:MAG: hypothetical protein NTY23_00405 [Chloroflexi bacterium]|nr:hypothetical protein [Chloroflexota bacterium]